MKLTKKIMYGLVHRESGLVLTMAGGSPMVYTRLNDANRAAARYNRMFGLKTIAEDMFFVSEEPYIELEV